VERVEQSPRFKKLDNFRFLVFPMKLAEALILRADCQKRLEQLRTRLLLCVKVQEGDQPPEDPNELLAEAARTADQFERLIQQINRTNTVTRLEGGSLSDLLARRDVLSQRRSLLTAVAEAAVVQQNAYSKSEVRFRSTVDIAGLRKQADDLTREHRELDARIQEANWKTDLLT